MSYTKLAIIPAMLMASGLSAQEIYHVPAPDTGIQQDIKQFFLARGTPVMLETTHLISTKDNDPGDRVYLEVAEPVVFRGQTVIPAGTRVRGEVTRVQRNGFFGRKGKIDIRVVSMVTPHGPIRLSGGSGDEGTSNAVASIGTMALVSGLGFIIRGTSGYIEPGTPVAAQLAQELTFSHYPQPNRLDARHAREAIPDSDYAALPGFRLLPEGGE